MPARLMELALAEWREGERLLHGLARLDPDHETVRLAVISLRDTYQELSTLTSDATVRLAECRVRINSAHDVIAAVRQRIELRGAPLTPADETSSS